MNSNATIQLNDGRQLPTIGLGVYGLIDGRQTEIAVKRALDSGYRHFDTAKLYGNEKSVGKAVREYDIDRSKVWITTKLWLSDFQHPKKTAHESLERLGLDYIDLYLIHWPTPVAIPGFDKKLWRAFESLVDEGVCKSIGVSNFQNNRLNKILSIANTPPAVNQVKCSPFTYPMNIHKFCQKNNIALVGYEPLDKAQQLDNPLLKELSVRYSKTPAQIMLRWAIQKEIVPIPKSKNENRIKENIDIFDFELSLDDIQQLDSLAQD